MDPGHCVHKTPHNKEGHCKERTGEDYVPHPVMAANLLEQVRGDIASHTGCEGIEENGGGVHGVMSVNVEHAHQCHDNDGDGQSQELTAIACKYRE